MAKVTIHDFVDAGVHFGHQTKRWNPKMKKYIFGARNGVHIFDLGKTLVSLNDACKFLYKTVAEGGDVLFVGTKRQAQDVIVEVADRSAMHYMNHRWLGGTLTNLPTIRKSIAKLEKIENQEETGELDKMKKSESSKLRREQTKLNRSLGGVRSLKKAPAALVVVDTVKEHIAIKEANRLGIPVVAIIDSNSNPDQIDFGIPGNDDAVRSIKIILDQLSEAVFAGKGIADQKAEEERVKREKEKAEEKARKEAEKKERAAAAKAKKEAAAKAKAEKEATKADEPKAEEASEK